jgi:hypothetical protein
MDFIRHQILHQRCSGSTPPSLGGRAFAVFAVWLSAPTAILHSNLTCPELASEPAPNSLRGNLKFETPFRPRPLGPTVNVF